MKRINPVVAFTLLGFGYLFSTAVANDLFLPYPFVLSIMLGAILNFSAAHFLYRRRD